MLDRYLYITGNLQHFGVHQNYLVKLYDLSNNFLCIILLP